MTESQLPLGQGLIVLGVNRSGTSALAAALQQLGVYFGVPEHIPQKGLRLDYDTFENEQVVQICNSLLHAFELGSIPCRSLPDNWMSYADIPDDIQAVSKFITRYFSGHPLWGWKVPSASLLLPFFESAFQDSGTRPTYLLTIRHPLEVANGLFKRQGIPVREGIGFWIHYMLTVLTQCDPSQLFLISYRSLVEDPERVLKPIWLSLSLPPPSTSQWESVRQAVRPELSRNRIEDDSLPAIASELWELVSSLSHAGRFQLETSTSMQIDKLNAEWQEWLKLTRMPTTSHCRILWRMGPRTGSDHFRGEREWHTFSIELSQTSGQAMEIRFMPLFGVVYLRELKWKTREQLIRPHVMATEGAFADFATDGSIRICTFGEAPHLAIQIPESLQGGFLMFELQFVVGNSAATEVAQRLAKARAAARTAPASPLVFHPNSSAWSGALKSNTP